MNSNYTFPPELRNLIIAALPEDTSLHGKLPELRHTYLPAAHVKALRPESMLVVGIRGSGKSFWWAALQNSEHRRTIRKQVGFDEKTRVSTGFGEKSAPDDYPGKDTISSLVQAGLDSRRIWQTIVLQKIGGKSLPKEFNRQKTWSDKVRWLQANPELVERLLFDADQELESNRIFHLVLFDALDRTADDWKTMNNLVRGLLQTTLDFRSYSRIRLKVFVRPDQIEDPEVAVFPDSSKVLSQKTELYWPRNELYGLLWQYLANESDGGRSFRAGCEKFVAVKWQQVEGIWPVPVKFCDDEEMQRRLFHGITGPWMGRDRRRGFPYTWLPNHLGDARRQVSPRSFLAALRHAALDNKPRPDYEYALHYESIKRGVQEASKIRVKEIIEDYPWVQNLFEPLSGISVPCLFDEIRRIWESKNVLKELEQIIKTATVRLPPVHIAKGSEGVVEDLESLGLVERLSDERINLPDVYRVGFGIGRRGGVKPAARG